MTSYAEILSISNVFAIGGEWGWLDVIQPEGDLRGGSLGSIPHASPHFLLILIIPSQATGTIF